MACLPRFFHRTKSSFSPTEDDNKDTLLNGADNAVQIGRYIRREETPIITPKSSERSIKQQVLQEDQSQQRYESAAVNNFNKKYSSKTKSKNHNNISNSNNNISHFSSNGKNVNRANSKLKSVKERRPTALPTDAVKIEDASYLSISAEKSVLNGVTDNKTASATQNTNFYIGAQRDDNDNDSLTKYNAKNKKSLDQVDGNNTFVPRLSSKPIYSSISSGKGKKGPPPVEKNEKANVPPPPPLPDKPLTTASSSASLASIKSNKTHRKTHSNTSTAANGGGRKSEEPSYMDKYHTDDLKYCTLLEVLNISDDSTVTLKSEQNGDVKKKDPSSTSEDSEKSDSPKSHRLGGLIFTRPNLPTQQNIEIKFIKKDEKTRNLIRAAIEKNDFLNNYMDNERKEMVIDAMSSASYEKDSFIIKENDEGSEIYVSEKGEFEVIKGGEVVGNFGAATVFGELAILYNAKRFASIKATTQAQVWKIERETFRNIMVISGSKEAEENLSFLRSAPFLKDLAADVLTKIVDLLQRKFYETNTCIVREGEVGNEFFIIRGGTVTIKKLSDDGVERIVDRRKRGEYFGEQALLNADRRQASVYADAPGTEVLKLDREAFISYMGTIPQLREKPENRNSIAEDRVSIRKSEFDNEHAHIKLKELEKHATLGAGAFGRVDLVSYAGKAFALKIIKKIDILKQDQIEHVYSEKHVMMKCRSSPFIIELYKTFRDDKYVYFLMEAMMGGDVWTVMSQRRFFDEKTAKFLAGCVVEAFNFLHSCNIIYRDLKPENLMLTTDGYCKLVDFGFAKHIPPNQKTNTFAGTPEYVAPEIILDRGHDRAVDYWALGILIFELIVGKTPFRGQNQIKIYQQILGGIDVIQMPSKIPKSAQGLIKHLCKQLPAERLGYQRRGILDIKKHSWFDGLDWNKLKNKQLVSPIKRPITNNFDLQYFVPAGTDHDHEPPEETSGWDIDF